MLQIKVEPPAVFSAHAFFTTKDGNSYRLSLSNAYKAGNLRVRAACSNRIDMCCILRLLFIWS